VFATVRTYPENAAFPGDVPGQSCRQHNGLCGVFGGATDQLCSRAALWRRPLLLAPAAARDHRQNESLRLSQRAGRAVPSLEGVRLRPARVSIRRTRLQIVLVLVAAENDDEDDPEAALPRVYSYNVTTPLPLPYPSRPTPEVQFQPPVWVWRGMGGVVERSRGGDGAGSPNVYRQEAGASAPRR
jgi:hypothetical protein